MARLNPVPAMLRNRVMALVLGLVCLPILIVTVSTLVDHGIRYWLGSEAEEVLTEALKTDEEALSDLAWRAGVRIRVLSTDGTIIHAVDYDHADRVGMTMSRILGKSGGPTLQQLDGDGNVSATPWFQDALRGPVSTCDEAFNGELLVCRAASRDGDRVVEVAETSRMALRVFHGLRFQLLKLTLYTLPFALFLGFIVGRIFVRPAERLVGDVRSRMGQVHPEPLGWTDKGEFGEIARAFDALQAELTQRRTTHAQAMADLAHELKNPVAALQMAGESLGGEGELTPARRERLSRAIESASGRLDRVVGEFLELARAETLRAGTPERINLLDIATGVASHLQQEQDAPITVEGEHVWTVVDPDHLQRVLFNLIENATSFSPKDGTVSVFVRLDGEHAVFEVTDDGPGIPDADKERLFERFFTSRPESGGTGLGLAIVKALVRSMDGDVHVQDAPDRGARFIVTLPAASNVESDDK